VIHLAQQRIEAASFVFVEWPGIDDRTIAATEPERHADEPDHQHRHRSEPQKIGGRPYRWVQQDELSVAIDNGLANPNATDFHDTDRGDGSFDYNCDTIEERFDATTAAATCVGAVTVGLCAARSGWVGAVPMCGGKGTYRQCTFTRGSGCSGTDIANRSQDCR